MPSSSSHSYSTFHMAINQRKNCEHTKEGKRFIVAAFSVMTLLAIAIATSSSSSLPSPFIQKAFADGLTQENLPPATIGNRDASLFVQVNPPVLTSATLQDTFMQFRLFDANNNQTIQHVTYHIAVTKASAAGSDQKAILNDFFHAHNSLLKIKIQPSEDPLIIYGNKDPFQNAYVADPGGIVSVKGPVLTDGGLYHFRIEIFGIDNDRNIFIPDDAPKFDSYLSVGDVSEEIMQFQGQAYNTTIISYYDKISDFNFDEGKQMLSWTMPFDWDPERIKSVNIFVHEEVRIPRSIEAIAGANSFDAEVNGFPLKGSMLSIDPYSSDTELTLHYLLNKNDLLSMSQQVPDGTADKMQFSLSPNTNAIEQTQSDISTDTGGIHVAVDWDPNQLSANTESTVKLSFSDAFTGGSLDADVKYDLRILDNRGNEMFSKTDLTAAGGTDTQTITFPADERYRLEVKVDGLVREGQATMDSSRNGLARGVVIVPEFPISVTLTALGILLAFVIVIMRRRGDASNLSSDHVILR